MSAAKKREKAERREARATQHVLSSMGVLPRREKAHLALQRMAPIVAVTLGKLDWRDPDTLLRAPAIVREMLVADGYDMQDLDVIVAPGAPLALRVAPTVAIVEEARRRVRREAVAA